MTIGDDIFTILGMVPIRDRAGIQRGTMADEAVKASGNAEGQALTMQGQAPPQIQIPPMGGPKPQGDVVLPDDVPTAYAAGKGQSKAMTIPPPQERVIASSPAANPSPPVRRGSDMILAQMERNKRAEDMNGLFASLGLIANAFNRGGGAEGTRSALAEQAFGGGSKAPSIAELIALNKVRGDEDAQAKAAADNQALINYAVKTQGLTPEDARAQLISGQLQKRFDPVNLRKDEELRQGEQLKRKLRPKIKELAELSGADPDVLAGQLESDPSKFFEQLTPKMLADVQKTLTDTDKVKFENLQTGAHMTSWANARKNPEEFMKRFGLTSDQIAPMLDDFGAMREFLKNSTPLHDELQRKKRDIQTDRDIAAGGTAPRVTTQEVMGLGKETPDLATQLNVESAKTYRKQYQEEHLPKAQSAKERIEGTGYIIADMFRDDLPSGGKLAQLSLDARKTIAKTLNMPQKDSDIEGEAFFSTLNRNILSREATMKGALSNADMKFLASLNGNIEMNPKTIRMLQHIEEKLNRYDIDAYRERYEGDQANEKIHKDIRGHLQQFTPIEQPKPSKITDTIVREKDEKTGTSGIEDVQAAIANGLTESPAIRKKFDQQFGRGMFKHYVQELQAGG